MSLKFLRTFLAASLGLAAGAIVQPSFAQSGGERYCHQYASIVASIAGDAIRQNPNCLDFSRGVHAVEDMHFSWCMRNSRSTVDGAADNIRRLARECSGGSARNNAAPNGRWQFCAQENGFCSAPPGATIRYGANRQFAKRRSANGGLPCTNRVFGDPIPNVLKACYYYTR